MVSGRTITGEDFQRAIEVNDSIANEHGADQEAANRVGQELGVDVPACLRVSLRFAKARYEEGCSEEEGQQLVCMAMTLGILGALRSVRLIELEGT